MIASLSTSLRTTLKSRPPRQPPLPLAVDGLSADTLGRRFSVEEHPRFAALLEANGPLRFPTDSALPDPYHGLVEGVEGHLPVHDCMGCVIHLDEKPWGLLTLDALAPERFSSVELDALQSFGSLAAATVSVAGHIERLESRVEYESQRAEGFRLAAKPRERTLIGRSPAMRQLQKEIGLVAGSELSVLIQGATGVGKELAGGQARLTGRQSRARRCGTSIRRSGRKFSDSPLAMYPSGLATTRQPSFT